MEFLALNLQLNARKATLGGRPHLVADATLIVPGILNGSEGPLLYVPHEIRKTADAWNGMPILRNHPIPNGGPPSGRTPEVYDKQGMGFVYGAHATDEGKLKAQLWFDEELTKRVDPRIYNALINGIKTELSTGLYTDNEPAENGAHFNGEKYTHVAKNYRPDHLAILPDQVGACSLKAGCGIWNQKTKIINGRFTDNGQWVITPIKVIDNCDATGKPGPCDLKSDAPAGGGGAGVAGKGLLNKKPSPMQAKAGKAKPGAGVQAVKAGSAEAADVASRYEHGKNTAPRKNAMHVYSSGICINCGGKGGKPGPCKTAHEKIKGQKHLQRLAQKFRNEGSQTYVSETSSPNMGTRHFIDVSHKDPSVESKHAKTSQKFFDKLSAKVRSEVPGSRTYSSMSKSPNMGTRVFVDVEMPKIQQVVKKGFKQNALTHNCGDDGECEPCRQKKMSQTPELVKGKTVKIGKHGTFKPKNEVNVMTSNAQNCGGRGGKPGPCPSAANDYEGISRIGSRLNLREAARHGIGAFSKEMAHKMKGQEVDYYEPKGGDKKYGKMLGADDQHHYVMDLATKKTHKFLHTPNLKPAAKKGFTGNSGDCYGKGKKKKKKGEVASTYSANHVFNQNGVCINCKGTGKPGPCPKGGGAGASLGGDKFKNVDRPAMAEKSSGFANQRSTKAKDPNSHRMAAEAHQAAAKHHEAASKETTGKTAYHHKLRAEGHRSKASVHQGRMGLMKKNQFGGKSVATGEKEVVMSREQTIAWLVANCDCYQGKNGAKALNEFSDEELGKLKENEEKLSTVFNQLDQPIKIGNKNVQLAFNESNELEATVTMNDDEEDETSDDDEDEDEDPEEDDDGDEGEGIQLNVHNADDEDEDEEEEDEKPKKGKLPPQFMKKNALKQALSKLSGQEIIAVLPEPFASGVTNAMAIEKSAKKAIVDKLTANMSGIEAKTTRQSLMGESLKKLQLQEKVFNSLQPTKNADKDDAESDLGAFFGASVPALNGRATENSDDDPPLGVPRYNYAAGEKRA